MKSQRTTIDLAGAWTFQLDPDNTGIKSRWFARQLDESIPLPGTTDEAKKGEYANEQCVDRLSRIWRWIGPAWYQRTVTIPKRWKGKHITLFLERTKDSQVWVDRTWIGSDDSISTPHEFDLSDKLTPGTHTITILIDNAKLPPVGPCHQVDERTQTNWNGIVGRIELIATDKIWIDDLQAYPDLESGIVRVKASIRNTTRWAGELNVKISAELTVSKNACAITAESFSARTKPGTSKVSFELPMPSDAPRWDEFDRRMITLTMQARTKNRPTALQDSHSIVFGMREFVTNRGQFIVNGRPTLLRGKNDCALFPLTGYAPMDKKEWKRLLGISASYGINHYRFHTWCPPEAAFQAADELGIYFAIELPNKREITAPGNKTYKPPKEAYETLDELKGDGGPPAIRTAYLTREGERMLQAYGNHPSFVMMTLGNELGGDLEVMNGMCTHFRQLDDRHLYAIGTGAFHWDIKYRPNDEFWVTRATAPGLEVRGASWGCNNHIDNRAPDTTFDYSPALLGVPVPVVGHEMAQYEVYPDYTETKKYRGVLKARCFDIFRKRLKDAGMLDQASDFLKASGALSVICHREDVEAALRTPGFGGFQMLDLQDFSGQGVALVGVLNVFMQSKGLITPEEWREFCCETVPLLWMTKYTWTNNETFQGRIRVAHYGPTDLNDQPVSWKICEGNKTLASGESPRMNIATGTVTEVDLFSASLAGIKAPQKLSVTLSVNGTAYRNSYDFWVYPAKVKTTVPRGIMLARSFSKKTREALEAGKRVLLIPRPGKAKQTVQSAFQTSFWSPMFRKPGRTTPDGKETPGVQGILCDPKHPVFKDFPTEFHGNWQWWQLMKNCQPLILDATPTSYRPTLQMIDGFDRNHKLGLICEAKVGKGKLLICSIDLPGLQKHPEARQLLASMQDYMKTSAFNPTDELDPALIAKII